MPKLDERISALEGRLKQLKAQQQQKDARRRAVESRRARRDDTRRKVLVGAIVLARIERGELAREALQAWLDDALSRPEDRALFDLPALPAPASEASSGDN